MADHMTAETLRAELVALADQLFLIPLPDDDVNAERVEAVSRRLRALAARLSGMEAVPEGYALVPIRATDEMIQSFHRGALNAAPDGDYHGKPTVSANAMYRAGYAALLFAAPEPPHV